MHRSSLVLAAASTLALAASAVPATAGTPTHLAGAPTLRVVNAHQAGLQIAVDHRLAKRHGAVAARVSVDGRRVRSFDVSGRHGRHFLYAGTVSRGGLQEGRRYTVRITFPGQKPIERQVKLHPRRG